MDPAWNVVGCCVSKINGADVDDVAFVNSVAADSEKIAFIDVKRVYLAWRAADTLAAVVSASFDLTQQNVMGYTYRRPIAVIELRGKNDALVMYTGGIRRSYQGCHLISWERLARSRNRQALTDAPAIPARQIQAPAIRILSAMRAFRSRCVRITMAGMRPRTPTSYGHAEEMHLAPGGWSFLFSA